jgi:hypothetical protein
MAADSLLPKTACLFAFAAATNGSCGKGREKARGFQKSYKRTAGNCFKKIQERSRQDIKKGATG